MRLGDSGLGARPGGAAEAGRPVRRPGPGSRWRAPIYPLIRPRVGPTPDKDPAGGCGRDLSALRLRAAESSGRRAGFLREAWCWRPGGVDPSRSWRRRPPGSRRGATERIEPCSRLREGGYHRRRGARRVVRDGGWRAYPSARRRGADAPAAAAPPKVPVFCPRIAPLGGGRGGKHLATGKTASSARRPATRPAPSAPRPRASAVPAADGEATIPGIGPRRRLRVAGARAGRRLASERFDRSRGGGRPRDCAVEAALLRRARKQR